MKKFSLARDLVQLAFCLVLPVLVLVLGREQTTGLVSDFAGNALGVLVGFMIGGVGILLAILASMQNALLVRELIPQKIASTLSHINRYNRRIRVNSLVAVSAYFVLLFFPILSVLIHNFLAIFMRESLLPAWWFYGYLQLFVIFVMLTCILDIASSMFVALEAHTEVIKGVSNSIESQSDKSLSQ